LGHLLGSPKSFTMATLYFQLERSKVLKDKTNPIYLVLKIKEGVKERRFRHYTGKSVLGKFWIGKGVNKRVTPKAPGATIVNSRLETLRNGADTIITNAQNLKVPLTLEYFRGRFQSEVLGKSPDGGLVPEKISFFEHLQNYIDSKKNIFQPATIQTYVTLKNSLTEFEDSIGYKIEFDTLNHIFVSLYTKYLIEVKKVINNTLAKRIATLKAFLTEMRKHKINLYNDFTDFEAKRDYDTTLMYLTQPEVMSLFNLKNINDKTMEKVRDAFCFACFTGIRFSDWGKIRPENIFITKDEAGRNLKVLKFTMHKVHKEIIIPLNEYALAIIEKYKNKLSGGALLPVYTNQETNRSLKELAKRAKINEVIQEVKKSGANRITHTNHKYDIISCHDARNSFATIYLENGGRPEVLQKLLGHSNFKQTMRYVKIVEKTVITDYFKTMGSAKILRLNKKLA